MTTYQPLRTCVATRQKLPQPELLRCVAHTAADGSVQIVPDPHRKFPGRGAWIRPTVEAWNVAMQRKALTRALKLPTLVVDADPVRVHIEQKETDD